MLIPLFCPRHPGQGPGTASHKRWTVLLTCPASPGTQLRVEQASRCPSLCLIRCVLEVRGPAGWPAHPSLDRPKSRVSSLAKLGLEPAPEATQSVAPQTMPVCPSVQPSSPDLCGVLAGGQACDKHGRHSGTRQTSFFREQILGGEAWSLEMGSAVLWEQRQRAVWKAPRGRDF